MRPISSMRWCPISCAGWRPTTWRPARCAVSTAAVHEREAELFYVIDGSGTMVTGGKLVNQGRVDPNNLSGSSVQGGTSRHLAKGDFIFVPENTPHWFSAIDGTLILMSLHVPRPVPKAP